MLWPTITADRSLSRWRPETWPTSSRPFRFSAIAKPNRLLADKAYDADSLRRLADAKEDRNGPSAAAKRTPYQLDRAA